MTRRDERLAFWQRRHAYVLAQKDLVGEQALLDAIAHDRVVAVAAARLLAERPASQLLLDTFFATHGDANEEISGVIVDDVVDHIGFRIREPLDVWLEGLALWAERLDFGVVGVKRFPASQAFRDRVGTFVEMAQVWLRRADVTVELELFDVHRPNPADRLSSVVPVLGTAARLAAATPAAVRPLLEGDDIWHFGVIVDREAGVETVHQRARTLVAEDHRFRLRTEATVANEWHGSVHTKVANLDLATEIEFLTYDVDWRARAGQ